MSVGASKEQTLLLILPSKKEVYPLSPVALTQAQSTRRQLVNDYRDSLILDRDGTLRRIEAIEILGPWGRSIGRKLLSRLTSAWHIAVRLSDASAMKFEELKALLAECIKAHGTAVFPALEEELARKTIIREILDAPTVEKIFQILQVPPPENALDVL